MLDTLNTISPADTTACPLLRAGAAGVYETESGALLNCRILAVRHRRPETRNPLEHEFVHCRPVAPVADETVLVRLELLESSPIDGLSAGDELLSTALRTAPAAAYNVPRQPESLQHFDIGYDQDESTPSGPWFGI